MFVALVIGYALTIAAVTTWRAERHGASGMTAGMASMMAAMGTGLSVGYGAGMLWHLGWANLVGVLAGGLHGLWMGRRWGPMAALDGAGGGVMGGLMGPMLAVMLLYLKTSLVLTAVLMLALQLLFSAGALYLVAAAAGGAVGVGWLGLLGRVLGAQTSRTDTAEDHYGVLGVLTDATTSEIAEAFLLQSRRVAQDPRRAARVTAALGVLSDPVRRARYDAARLEEMACCEPQPSGSRAAGTGDVPHGKRARKREREQAAAAAHTARRETGMLGVVIALAALVLLGNGLLFTPPAGGSANVPVPSSGAPADAASGDGAGDATPAASSAQVQEVAMSLRYPSYEPSLVEVRRGVPVRLTMEAIGDPG